jgi:signal transduction histidine kinase
VRLLREGAQDLLDKPFSPDELCARVRNFVARKQIEDANERLRRQLEDVSAASMAVSAAIAGLPDRSVSAVIDTIALHARTLVSAEFAAVGVGTDPDQPFELWAIAGLRTDQAAAIGRQPRPTGVLRQVMTEDRTVRLRDVRRDPAFVALRAHHPVVNNFLGTPIRHRGRIEGTLYLANKRDAEEFSEQDARLVEILADRVGVAIETARVYAAEASQRAWLHAVVDQMPNGIVLTDAHGRITEENRSALALRAEEGDERARTGSATHFDLRYPSGERIPPNDLPIVKAVVHRETTPGQECVVRQADGRLVPLLVSAAPIEDTNGEPTGAVMVLQDVSVVKELERLRDEWSSIVAHDLQQPITVITLSSERLLASGLDPAHGEIIRQILMAASRLSHMVNDLNDASLLETHRLAMATERLDLGALVREVIARAPEAAGRATVHTPIDHQLFVKGDAYRLEQVLTNLLSNAVKYGTPGTAIRIDVRHIDTEAQVAVSNEGEGIPTEELPLIFERYVRSRTVIKGPRSGRRSRSLHRAGGRSRPRRTHLGTQRSGRVDHLRVHRAARRAAGRRRAGTGARPACVGRAVAREGEPMIAATRPAQDVADHVFPPSLVPLLRDRASRCAHLDDMTDAVLIRLLTTVFWAGLETYEGESNRIAVAFLGSSQIDVIMSTTGDSGGPLIYQWKVLRLDAPRPFAVTELVKLAVAGRKQRLYAAVNVLPNGSLAITGLAHEGFQNDDGLVTVTASRPGRLSIRAGRDLLIGYDRGTVMTGGRARVFATGPIRRALEATATAAKVDRTAMDDYVDAVSSLVREMSSHGRGGIIILSHHERPEVPPSAAYRMSSDGSLVSLLRLAHRVGNAATGEEPPRAQSAAFATVLRNAFRTEAERVIEEMGALTAIDGALILNCELTLVAFGVVLPLGGPLALAEAADAEGLHTTATDFGHRGTRHHAAAAYASAHRGAVVFVASEDGLLSCMFRPDNRADTLIWRLGPADIQAD